MLHESHNDLVFETRLRDDRTITLLFSLRGINFQDFLDRFCEGWRVDAERMGSGTVKVRASIVGAGEYQLSFGLDRRRSWGYIMKMAGGTPETHILVTVSI